MIYATGQEIEQEDNELKEREKEQREIDRAGEQINAGRKKNKIGISLKAWKIINAANKNKEQYIKWAKHSIINLNSNRKAKNNKFEAGIYSNGAWENGKDTFVSIGKNSRINVNNRQNAAAAKNRINEIWGDDKWKSSIREQIKPKCAEKATS